MIWASLVAQMVKNLPAMQETWVRFLGWEDPLEKGKATHSSILDWRIPWGRKEWNTTERLSLCGGRKWPRPVPRPPALPSPTSEIQFLLENSYPGFLRKVS